MALFDHRTTELISQETGEIDMDFVKRHAAVRAAREWGSDAYPPATLRDQINDLRDRAQIMRARWRADRGLADDTVYVSMSVPACGSSGDSFRSAR